MKPYMVCYRALGELTNHKAWFIRARDEEAVRRIFTNEMGKHWYIIYVREL